MLLCSWLIRLLVPSFLVTSIYPHDLSGLYFPQFQEWQDFTYHSSASEVRLVFFAADENNRSVQGLQSDDFAVIDNGWVIRNFRSFTRSGLVNLDVIVLIDSSESVLPRFHREIADVLSLVSAWPWEPGDNVSILSFSGMEVNVVCAGNCRSWFTAERMASLPSGGATPLFDAVMVATDLLTQRRQPDVWPVILLFSDGDDTISKASFNGTLKKILASEEQIYTVDLGDPGRPSNGTAILQKMAEDSGGRYIPLSDGPLKLLNDVMDDLHSGLLVTYAPPESSSEFHSIRILPTHNLNLQFRCRRGYYDYRRGSAHQEDGP
ncbi:MAG: VWA domain-containing protein [Candidatus Sulfotelmatobacter sp.]